MIEKVRERERAQREKYRERELLEKIYKHRIRNYDGFAAQYESQDDRDDRDDRETPVSLAVVNTRHIDDHT